MVVSSPCIPRGSLGLALPVEWGRKKKQLLVLVVGGEGQPDCEVEPRPHEHELQKRGQGDSVESAIRSIPVIPKPTQRRRILWIPWLARYGNLLDITTLAV
ncbi:hypothetical protein H106_02403 [Trichophyton rubrum CBS 735.88]|nr:hypothetical protein H106_02403 [Trichophyton rubrum CBS 735.88]